VTAGEAICDTEVTVQIPFRTLLFWPRTSDFGHQATEAIWHIFIQNLIPYDAQCLIMQDLRFSQRWL
jgi:hypothetical protein